MTKFFNKFKKLCFWPIFQISEAKKILPENPALSCTISYGSLALRQNFEKTNDTIPRKRPDRRKDRRKGRKTDRPYFIGPFRLPPEVQFFLNFNLCLCMLSSYSKNIVKFQLEPNISDGDQ